MSDEKYSIDDILAEIDRKRESSDGSSKGGYDGSITEIIGGSELDEAIRATKKKHNEEPVLTAKQRTEEEENERRAEEISAAADRRKAETKRKAEASRQEKLAREEAEKQKKAEQEQRRLAEQKSREEAEQQKKAERREAEQRKKAEREERLAAKQRTESEVNARRAAEISAAADRQKAEKAAQSEPVPEKPAADKHSGVTAELSSPNDAAKLFGAGEREVTKPESEHVKPFVKPKVAGEDEDIVFHTRSDLVTTETMQLRKQQRIEEINRALLRADSAAETPDELLDSLNPMDSRAKAAEDLKTVREQDIGDTLAVAGNDLKRIAGGTERVKEYSPVSSRKRTDAEKRADDILFNPVTARQAAKSDKLPGSETFVDSLSKQAKLQHERKLEAEQNIIDEPPEAEAASSEPLNIDEKQFIDTSVLSDTAEAPTVEDDPVEAVRRADELAQKKKRKLSGFILEDIEDGVDSAASEEEADDEYEEEEEIDLDDESVISERLTRASKGLMSRLIILAVLLAASLFIGITNQFNINLGFITDIVSKVSHPDYFLYSYLVIGILSFTACSSVITNGFSRLIKLRPDGDTLCAFAHITAILALVPYLSLEEYIQRGRSHVYLIVSLTALCLNTISKLCTVKAAQRNFSFVSGDSAKYFVQHSESESAEQLAKGAVSGVPVVASMRKTELLCDFIISTYCEDVSDRIARVTAPITLCVAVAGGLIAFFTGESQQYVMNNVSWAATVASAIFSIGAAFSGSFIVALPMLSASRTMTSKNAAILGYNAVEEFSETNAVLVEAKTLFPANSVKINNIWDYNKHRSNKSSKVPIDEAIIYAASLAVASDSVLSDAFFNMLNYKQQLLKPVNNCVYESNLGVLGWIERRRVLLGNREHMKSHEIVVPDMKKEAAANKNGDEVIYLAVDGEVCMLFFVELSANTQVKQNVQKLAKHGVSLVIKTVDGMITDAAISELFDISAERVRIIPFESHEAFNEHTKFVPKGCAAVSCDGTFTSFAAAINGAKNLREKITFGCTVQVAGVALGMLLAIIFMLFAKYSMFNCFYILLYNIAWAVLTFVVQAFKRI